MGFILLDPPWEANESPEGLERWIAELNSMEEEYGADPEIRGQIREEREGSQRVLAEMRAHEGEQPKAGGAAEGDGE